MRQSACISAAAVLAVTGVLLFTTDAHAQDPGTPSQPPAQPPAAAPAATPDPNALPPVRPRERRGDDDEEEEIKHFALTLNPLSLILTRIGLNVEYLFAKHHGLIFNPFFQSLSVGDSALAETKYTNFGAELGYRFYTGSRGANGFFVGPFGTFIASSTTQTVRVGNNTSSAEQSITIYGGGVDLGGQHVFHNGFTIGGGGGIMYVTASETKGLTDSGSFKVSGVLPRFLFTIGWSF